jgi:hypothetical protein
MKSRTWRVLALAFAAVLIAVFWISIASNNSGQEHSSGSWPFPEPAMAQGDTAGCEFFVTPPPALSSFAQILPTCNSNRQIVMAGTVGLTLPYGSSPAATTANSYIGVGGVYNSASPAPSNGQYVPLQVDSTGRLYTNDSISNFPTTQNTGEYLSAPGTLSNATFTPLMTDNKGFLILSSQSSASSGEYLTSPPTLSNTNTTPLMVDSTGHLILSSQSNVAGSEAFDTSHFPSYSNSSLNPNSVDLAGRQYVTGQAAAGAAVAGNPLVTGMEGSSGFSDYVIGCDQPPIEVNVSSTGLTSLQTHSASTAMYLCGYSYTNASGPAEPELEYGTGTTCGTGTTPITPIAYLGAQAGFVDGGNVWRGLKVPANDDLCVNNVAGAGSFGVTVYWTKF